MFKFEIRVFVNIRLASGKQKGQAALRAKSPALEAVSIYENPSLTSPARRPRSH